MNRLKVIIAVTVLILFTVVEAMADFCYEPGQSHTFTTQVNDYTGAVDASSVGIRIYVNTPSTPVNYSGSGGTNGIGSMSLADSSNTDGFYSYAFSMGTAPTEGVHTARMCATVGGVTSCDLASILVVNTVGKCGRRTPQEVRDAMKLAPTAGAPATGSVDEHLDDIVSDTAEIGVAGAGLTNIDLPNQVMNITGDISGSLSGSVGAVAPGGITPTSIDSGAIGTNQMTDALKKQLGWVTDLSFTGNTGTYCLTANGEAISSDNQFRGMTLVCDNEERTIEASVSVVGPADIVCTEAGRPYSSAPTGTCNVRVK